MHKLTLMFAVAAALAFASAADASATSGAGAGKVTTSQGQNRTCRDANGRVIPCGTTPSTDCADGKHCPSGHPTVAPYQSGGHGH
jgi:hypothetical protein